MIQRVWRGVQGRRRARARAEEMKRILILTPAIIIVQKLFRGHRSRSMTRFVADTVRKMYSSRRREACTAMAGRLQSIARRYLSGVRLAALKEVLRRRKLDEKNACILMQTLVRIFLSKLKLLKLKLAKAQLEQVREKSASRIQAFYHSTKGRYNARLSSLELRLLMRKRLNSTHLLQRVYRGYQGRQKVRRRRIELATRWFAAVTIQRVYRGSKVLHWRDMRLNVVAAFVLDRQYVERKDRVADARNRYQRFLHDLQRDSASESDPEPDEDDAWTKHFDYRKKTYYWYNTTTQQYSYEEPRSEVQLQKSLIGMKVKIHWLRQGQWFSGTISKYHRKKMRHRIDYDDGDHEWLNLELERDRVQVELPDGSWVMYQLYRPDELKTEWKLQEEQRQEEDYKAKAFKDANQWKLITDDTGENKILYLSDTTGEIRTGVEDALSWVIQDDGFGFPCFFNLKTGLIVHEDPRFVEGENVNLEGQRAFVMQELRYTMYFCLDYWKQYNDAIRLKDAKQERIIMKMIYKSNKPKLLTSLLLRAKALYEPSSVVDRPVEEVITQELNYTTWLVERLAEVCQKAVEAAQASKDIKTKILGSIIKDHQPLFCAFCKHETKRNLEYCPTCGKLQVFY